MTAVNDDLPMEGIAGALGRELGLEEVRTGSWFTKLVQLYLRRNLASERPAEAGGSREAQAEQAIRRACVKTGAAGLASGLTSTGSALLAWQTAGIGALVGVPATAGGVLGDVLYRALVHIDLTCRLGAIYGIQFDPDDPADLLRLYTLVFESSDDGGGGGSLGGARGLLERAMSLGDPADLGLKIGRKLLGQALRRNLVPAVGVVTATVGNVRATRKLGETVHRYLRYQRALQETVGEALAADPGATELALEGVWFVLTADGHLQPEEAAILAWMLRQHPAVEHGALRRRFVEDDASWLERLQGFAGAERTARERLLHVFEVAAAVDQVASLPERRTLRHAARALDVPFDQARVEALTGRFDRS